jgi:predicted enzyme related to lactoylglutathione lyase
MGMKLGNFSVSLTVKDIKASRAFYEKLGFEQIDGVEEQNWLIMRSGTTIIGLFQGMFEKNIMTFNPRDVRGVQAKLKELGIQPMTEAEGEEGPASMMVQDPDGNTILFDQHDLNHQSMKAAQGKVVWHDLTVPNASKVRDFYAAVVGWKPEELSMGDYADYAMYDSEKNAVGVCHKRGMNENVPSGWMMYVNVHDLKEAIEKVKANGGKILEVRNKEDGSPQMAYIEDPEGAVCGLFEA